jgi:hypothetical protein
LGKFSGEVAEIAQDGRKAGGEEDCQDEQDGDDEENDGDGARGMVSAKTALADVRDGGYKNDCEEGADVEDDEFFAEGPREREKKENCDAEEDVAADLGAGSLVVWGEVFGRGLGQRVLLGFGTAGC